jgi:hypothetical protein
VVGDGKDGIQKAPTCRESKWKSSKYGHLTYIYIQVHLTEIFSADPQGHYEAFRKDGSGGAHIEQHAGSNLSACPVFVPLHTHPAR